MLRLNTFITWAALKRNTERWYDMTTPTARYGSSTQSILDLLETLLCDTLPTFVQCLRNVALGPLRPLLLRIK